MFKPQEIRKVDQVFKPSLASFFQHGSCSAIFLFFSSLFYFRMKKTKQVINEKKEEQDRANNTHKKM